MGSTLAVTLLVTVIEEDEINILHILFQYRTRLRICQLTSRIENSNIIQIQYYGRERLLLIAIVGDHLNLNLTAADGLAEVRLDEEPIVEKIISA